MGFLDSVPEFVAPEKPKKEATGAEKQMTNQLLHALGYGPHYEEPAPAAAAPASAAPADAPNDAPAPPSRAELDALQAQIDKFAAERGIGRGPSRTPELDDAQQRSDERANILKRATAGIAEERAAKDRRRAAKLLRKAGIR